MRCRSRHDYARRLHPSGTAGERQQSDIARSLQSHTQPALMTRTDSGHAARQNLSALLNELRKNVRALVVDHVHLFHAELADFLLAEKLAFAAPARSGTARATRTTFTSSAARSSVTTFAPPASTTWRCSLFLFLCHDFHLSLLFNSDFEIQN
jgi:hypothetical protein